MTDHPLFRPFTLKALTLPNRVVMAPMTRARSPAGVPGDDVAAYYRRRAEGRVGLIMTEGTTVDRPGASGDPSIPNFHAPASLEGWRKVVDAVHAAGGRIAPQLWHQGALRRPGTGPSPQAPSDSPSGLSAPGVPNGAPMTEEDIADAVQAFARAAASARQLGFDALEVHGAHGYLLDQFFWEGTNHRSDRYGGDLIQRTRFGAEVLRAIRAAVGDDFVVVLRFSQWKAQDYEARLATTPDELARFLEPLADAGVDLFHCSTRRFWQPEFPGSQLNLAGWTKKLTGKPTITVGSVGLAGEDFTRFLRRNDPTGPAGAEAAALDDLLERLDRGEFDLVALGRALIADPAWPQKVRDGQQKALHPFTRDMLTAELA